MPDTSAARLRDRYRYAIDVASRTLPVGPPPPKRNTGGWEGHQSDAWNLAKRMRDDEANIPRFLTDTRISFSNDNAERPLRPASYNDKISGTFHSVTHAKTFATIRSYLGAADKHEEEPLPGTHRAIHTRRLAPTRPVSGTGWTPRPARPPPGSAGTCPRAGGRR